ncbi:YraN family protein [Psychrobacter immobilis]|uniref:YraN family protein n=1 Tax=Psychrobacter immobilis TaxID=498 RepID=UPI001917AD41|nr:YraN family protein [Psychrobacter immobilis]
MMCYDNSEMLTRPIDLMCSHKPLSLTSPKQRQGSLFEQQACEFLQSQGLILIAQNWQQVKVGELDLIMLETGSACSTLVFIEVRQRQRSGFGGAALSVTASKQRKVIKTAQYFLQQHPEYEDYDCRFDVIAYDTVGTHLKTSGQNVENQPQWLKSAFIVDT